jgi:hypothetical protein
MIALTIMSVVLLALGGLMFQVSQRSRTSAATIYRTAAAQKAAAHIQSLPWGSIDGTSGCTADSSGLMAYNRCISVTNAGAKMKQITVVISPTGIFTALPETLLVVRSLKSRPVSPF